MGTLNRDDVWLCLHLYEQRREPVLREARAWVAEFAPKSFKDIQAVVDGKKGDDANRFFRQGLSYWEMICALLNSGGVSEECRQLFAQTTREWLFFWSKIAPFIDEIRATYRPTAYQHLEAYSRAQPDYEQTLAFFQKMSARTKATKPAKKPKR